MYIYTNICVEYELKSKTREHRDSKVDCNDCDCCYIGKGCQYISNNESKLINTFIF